MLFPLSRKVSKLRTKTFKTKCHQDRGIPTTKIPSEGKNHINDMK